MHLTRRYFMRSTGALAVYCGLAPNRLIHGLEAMAAPAPVEAGKTLVVTLSDFGRTAAQNGSSGTDHGWANCMLALGGPVAAKRKKDDRPVLGTWPGLAPDQLNQKRDLLHTTDFRDVLAEIVGSHLGNENLKSVLPSHDFKPAGLIV